MIIICIQLDSMRKKLWHSFWFVFYHKLRNHLPFKRPALAISHSTRIGSLLYCMAEECIHHIRQIKSHIFAYYLTYFIKTDLRVAQIEWQNTTIRQVKNDNQHAVFLFHTTFYEKIQRKNQALHSQHPLPHLH